MPLVTRIFASSEHACDQWHSSSAKMCLKTRTVRSSDVGSDAVKDCSGSTKRTDLLGMCDVISVEAEFVVRTRGSTEQTDLQWCDNNSW
jgi:hypothetical protein